MDKYLGFSKNNNVYISPAISHTADKYLNVSLTSGIHFNLLSPHC